MSTSFVILGPFFVGSFLGGLFGWLMSLLSIFLILLILVQRGRGGGLTGALGGPGGQSAFGSKAGDMFTKITFATAGVWILLCALAMWSLGNARTAVVVPPAGPTMRGTGTEPELPGEAAAPTGSMSGLSVPSDLGSLDALTNPPAGEAATGETPAGEVTAEDFPAEPTTPETPAEPAATEPAATEPAATEPAPAETPADGAGTESGTEQPASDTPAGDN